MRQAILEMVNQFKAVYPLDLRETDYGCDIILSGGRDKLGVGEEEFECILFAEEWHEHCSTVDVLRALLAALLSGRAQLVVKYRGKDVVGHQLQILEGEEINVTGFTHALYFPFWRKKSYAIIRYMGGHRTIEQL